MKTNSIETQPTIYRTSSEKQEPMKKLIAGAMLALPIAGLISGLSGMGSSAEQSRDTLGEVVKEMNSHSETYEGLMPSGEALKGLVSVGEDGISLHEGYNGDQLDLDNSTSGATLSEDLHTAEAYVREVYGDNVPSEFVELFAKAEQEIAHNRHSANLALGSTAASLVGIGGAVALTRSKSKRPTDPTSIDTL